MIKKRDKVIPLSDEILTNLTVESNSNIEESSQLLYVIQQLRLDYRTAINIDEDGKTYYEDYSVEVIEINDDSYIFNFINLKTKEETILDSTQI